MNVVFIVPTGIGCAIGGHAGDATPAAKAVSAICDKLILHPNVVNASDINEMPPNALYVEGSMLDCFLEGSIGLQEVRRNKILVAVSPPILPETINAIRAAEATIGTHISWVELKIPLIMEGWVKDGVATGSASGIHELIAQVSNMDFDALAIASPINVKPEVSLDYFRSNVARVNPWGGIEAFVSRCVSEKLRKPVAHAPIENRENSKENLELLDLLYKEIVDPRKAAEVCSNCFIHCVLKGLHQAPRISRQGITFRDVDALITPTGCIGRPHRACFEVGIPVIAVKENTTAYNSHDDRVIYVENYWEAVGYLSCIKAGVSPRMVRSTEV